MAFFRIAEGRGIRFTTTGDEIDVVPSTLRDFEVDDIPFTQNGSTFVFDFSGRGTLGGSPLGDVVAVVAGRRFDEIRILDRAGGLLVETGDFPLTLDLSSFFPLNQSSDEITGAELGDFVDAGLGDDVVAGLGGADTLIGGLGADRLLGGAGGDRLLGGAGDDILRGGRDGDDLRGGGGADRAFGGAGADRLGGGGGADKLKGGGGGDLIIGGAGADSLSGGVGADTLKGGGGADRLAGDKGDDVLISGGGFDVFVFTATGGRDRIMDYAQDRDVIEIRSGAGAFDDLVIRQRGDDVRIRFAETVILVEDQNKADFTAADFVFT